MIPNHDRQLVKGHDDYFSSEDFQNYFEACNMDELIYQFLKNGDNYFSALEIVDPKDTLGYPMEVENTTQSQLEALVLAVKNSPDLMAELEEQEETRFESND